MKKRVLFVLLALTVLGVTASHAQTQGLINAHVPFDFVVNERTYPAGDYSVLLTSTYSVWILRGTNQTSVFLVTQSPESNSPPAQSKLLFHCYDNRKVCFLAEVWFSDNRSGRRLPETRHERELARITVSRPTAVASK
jgi:hypothetical protein